MKDKSNKKILSFILLFIFSIISIYYKEPITSNVNNIQKKEIDTVDQAVNKTTNSLLTISFIDVGQADCILIENEHEYILVDGGNNADGEKLVAYFKSLGITNFTHIFATHAHEDHIGGLDDIIDNFDVKNFHMPDAIHTSKTFEDILDSLEEKEIGLNVPEMGNSFNIGNTKIEVMYIDPTANELNDSSIILKVTYGTTSFLLMGDASTKVEKELLNKDIKSDVLKVGHHGSNYSTSVEFLDKVNPQFAIISVGEKNNYNHPHKAILSRFENRNIKLYRTDEMGTITAKSNGTIITFDTTKTNTNG